MGRGRQAFRREVALQDAVHNLYTIAKRHWPLLFVLPSQCCQVTPAKLVTAAIKLILLAKLFAALNGGSAVCISDEYCISLFSKS